MRRAARLAAILIAGASVAANEPQVVTPPPSTYGAFAQFANVIECLQKHYLYPLHIGASEHAAAAMREFVRSVDQDADFLTADEVASLKNPDAGDIGVILALRNDYPTVIAARDGSQAQSARLLAGDQIIGIEGQSTKHARLFSVASQLRGAVGSKVLFRVLDPESGKVRDIRIERTADRSLSPPPLKFLSNRVAYFRVSEFTSPVVEKLQAAVMSAQAEQTRSLILDLRNTSTGAFEATLRAARLFLPTNDEIVTLDYSDPVFRTTFVSDASEKSNIQLILLVNGGTAAEAEIFAAALRDHKRARFVGSKTFGRGAMIAQFPLPDGSALSIPTAQYLPPSKQLFHGTGLAPDVEVILPRETERSLATVGFGAFNWTDDKREVLATDRALAKAFELLAK